MRLIPYKTDYEFKSEPLMLSNNMSKNMTPIKSENIEFCKTKQNIFPDNFLYKCNWLNNGYKSTYKKDFIELKKTRSSNSLPKTRFESKHNMVGKIYPSNYIINKQIITNKSSKDWNNPYKYLNDIKTQ